MRKWTRLSQWLSAVFGRQNQPELTSILVVDDDAQVRTLVRERLEIAGYRVDEAPNGEVALGMYRDSPTDVVLTDIVMPEMDGREFISLLRNQFADVRIVAISGAIGHDVPELLRDGLRRGALQTLQKPFTSQQMLDAIQAVLTWSRRPPVGSERRGPRGVTPHSPSCTPHRRREAARAIVQGVEDQ